VPAISWHEAIVVAGTLAVLIAVWLPAWAASKKKACRISCANNLKQIGLSFRQWALDNHDKFPMQVSVANGGTMELVGSGAAYPHFRVLSNELLTPMILVCFEDTKARNEMGKVMAAHALARGTNSGYAPPFFPTNFPVSYFVGVDAQPDRPRMFLSGDANLAVGGRPAKRGLLSLWTNSPVEWAKPLRPNHGEGGNIVLVDGMVSQVGNTSLHELLQGTNVATNRLAMP
jgi:hypothetical protein